MGLPEMGSENEEGKGKTTVQGGQKMPPSHTRNQCSSLSILVLNACFHNDKDGSEIGTEVPSLGQDQSSTCRGITELI